MDIYKKFAQAQLLRLQEEIELAIKAENTQLALDLIEYQEALTNFYMTFLK